VVAAVHHSRMVVELVGHTAVLTAPSKILIELHSLGGL